MDRAAKKPVPSGDRKTRLHIFDFDQTLFHSPGPPPNLSKEDRGKFWHDPESLGGDLVPDDPNQNWYVQHVVEAFRRAKKDPRAVVVVMTGRSEPMRKEVERLLERNDLEPDELVLKPKKEPTKDYKTREMKRLLAENPDVKKVHFYEDREHHLRDFQEAAEREGYQFVPHYVTETDADRTWDDFMWTFYEGGSKQVQNTNRETRDRHPKVRADYLMRQDPSFASRVQGQFRKWVSMGKPRGRREPPPAQARTARGPRLLCLELDLSPGAVRRRVVARHLRRLVQRT